MRDVNNTGFKLVLGRANWRDTFGVDAAATVEAEAEVVYDVEDRCVTLRPRVDRFPRSAVEPALSSADRTSAGRDRYGSWYWIDPDDRTRILVRNAGDGLVEPFWPPVVSPESEVSEAAEKERGPFRPVQAESRVRQPLGGLAITTDHRLVVGARQPDQLLVFDLHAGGPPERIPWFGEETFGPVDMTRRPDGGLYLLDAPEGEQPRIWLLDRRFRPARRASPAPKASVFRPVDTDEVETTGEGERSPPVPPAGPLSLPAGVRPQVIEALPDDTLLVLSVSSDAEGGESVLYRYRPGETGGAPIELGQVDLTELLEPAEEEKEDIDWHSWRAHDIAFQSGSPGLTEAFRGTVYVVGRDGNQAYAVALSGDSDDVEPSLRMQYIPLRKFSGKGLVEVEGEVYYDLGSRWIPLTVQRRPRFVDHGHIRSTPFDSSIPACTWHRVFIDACIPSDTSVRIETRASDSIDRLTDRPWRPEPNPYRRSTGAEIPYYDPFPNRGSRRDGRGTWEVLLQNAEGRYLQIRLVLEGSGRAAPRLYALRVYGPRFSYLEEYLPDLYQEDESSASFVERFLAISEGTLTHIEGRIAAVQALFDVRTVPDEYVDWLGTWFGTRFDRALDVRRKRLFLRHAVELYDQRGTLAGLARMLTLILDPCADESLFTPAGIAAAVARPRDADDRTAYSEGIRLVEQFVTRDMPRAAVGDARTPEQPVEVRVDEPWTPADGAEVLHRRFRTFLDRERYDGSDARKRVWESSSFPPLLPSSRAAHADRKRADWRAFVHRVIKGPYAVIDEGDVQDQPGEEADETTRRFRAFLQRRYRAMDRLKTVWSVTAANFDDIRLPRDLPAGDALRDWMHFVGAVLPIHRTAHRFSVLVPVDPDTDVAEQRARLDLARRVVERERPVHASFEVLPYAAAFRVGIARIGLDTVLGEGGRYLPLLLGEGALARRTLGYAHPYDVPDRRIVGRDTVDTGRPL